MGCFRAKQFLFFLISDGGGEEGGGGGLLPYIGYTGMCRCIGYGFQAF